MPFTGGVHTDQQDFADFLDKEVESGAMSIEEATRQAQTHGLVTGPGGGYQAPGQAQAETDATNDESRQSVARSQAYQASRAGNPEGFGTPADQDAFNAAHPLSEYK